jgi:20S proteasome subunit beta 1
VAEKIYTCRSGSAADTQALSDYVRNYLAHYKAESGKEPTVKVAAHLFHSMSYANKDRLTAGIIVGGALPKHLSKPAHAKQMPSRMLWRF